MQVMQACDFGHAGARQVLVLSPRRSGRANQSVLDIHAIHAYRTAGR
jgi:hypothetical protein